MRMIFSFAIYFFFLFIADLFVAGVMLALFSDILVEVSEKKRPAILNDIRFVSFVMNSLCLVVGIFYIAMMDPNNTFRSLFFSFSLDFYH